VAARYGRKDYAGLSRLYAQVQEPSDELLLRYRLYPLTLNALYLEGLPEPDPNWSARDYALLSALWAYRIAEAPAWRVPAYGRRSDALLRQARARDADDPFVLLIEGQSLLYRPTIFGGSSEAGLQRFVRLRDRIRQMERRGARVPGLPLMEAQMWVWYALHRSGHPGAPALRSELLAANPAPLYREFLLSPP
jgi:hypothetical protein